MKRLKEQGEIPRNTGTAITERERETVGLPGEQHKHLHNVTQGGADGTGRCSGPF